MASAGALADFAKRPPQFKAAVFAAVAVVLGLLYYQFVFASMRRDIKAAEGSKVSLISSQKKIKEEIVEYTQLMEQKTKLDAIIKENSDALPTAAQLPGFFDLLNLQAKAAQVQVRRWVYEKEIAVEDVYKVPVEIQLAGTYFQIEHFFYLLHKVSQKEKTGDAPTTPGTGAGSGSGSASAASAATADKLKIEERGRILTIENLVIEDPEMTKDGLVLTATFRASTFRKELQVDDEDPAAKAKKDKAEKKAADKKAKKGLPAKVKDKVEEAVDKSDARVREAGGSDSTLPSEPEAEGVDGVKKGM